MSPSLSQSRDRISIVVPAKNEVATIVQVIEKCKPFSDDIIVVGTDAEPPRLLRAVDPEQLQQVRRPDLPIVLPPRKLKWLGQSGLLDRPDRQVSSRNLGPFAGRPARRSRTGAISER